MNFQGTELRLEADFMCLDNGDASISYQADINWKSGASPRESISLTQSTNQFMCIGDCPRYDPAIEQCQQDCQCYARENFSFLSSNINVKYVDEGGKYICVEYSNNKYAFFKKICKSAYEANKCALEVQINCQDGAIACDPFSKNDSDPCLY